MGTTRFPNGVTTATFGQTLGEFILPDPTKAHVYFNDFDTYVAGDWTVTGVGTTPTQALTDGDGGLLLITNAAADNDSSFNELATESFLFASGKRLWFKARFKVSDATQSDFIVGLTITDTTPIAAVTDGVYFLKDDGDALLDLHVEKNSTDTTTAGLATVVDDTFLTVGFYYDGLSTINAYVDDAYVGSSATTNLPDDEALAVQFGIQNGAAAAKTMTVDYIFVAKER